MPPVAGCKEGADEGREAGDRRRELVAMEAPGRAAVMLKSSENQDPWIAAKAAQMTPMLMAKAATMSTGCPVLTSAKTGNA